MQLFPSVLAIALSMQSCLISSVLATTTTCSVSETPSASNSTRQFKLTAITGNANGESVFECWQLGPFPTSNTAGVIGSLSLFLGEAANATLAVLPPRFNGGLHTAPAVQYVWFTSGLVHVTLPNSTDDVWIQGGKYGLIVAADIPDVSKLGHITSYPSDADTVALQMPTRDGKIPTHEVLHDGACRWEEMAGI